MSGAEISSPRCICGLLQRLIFMSLFSLFKTFPTNVLRAFFFVAFTIRHSGSTAYFSHFIFYFYCLH